MIVINFFGGPGSGKSTFASGVFSDLKRRGVSCEYCSEYAKDLVWELSLERLKDQLLVTAVQNHKLVVHKHRPDSFFCVTDSPVLLGEIYRDQNLPSFVDYVGLFKDYNNLNYFVERGGRPYNPYGRTQTESQSVEIDKKIMKLLDDNEITYKKVSLEKLTPANLVSRDLIEATKD